MVAGHVGARRAGDRHHAVRRCRRPEPPKVQTHRDAPGSGVRRPAAVAGMRPLLGRRLRRLRSRLRRLLPTREIRVTVVNGVKGAAETGVAR